MSPDEIRAWVREHRLATLPPTASLPSLFTWVTGEQRVSNWWSHPRAGDVWNASQVLGHDADVRVVRLADGKITFLHRALWPALLGVVLNEGFATRAAAELSEVASQLLASVVAHGPIRMDRLAARDGMPPRKQLGKARRQLLDRLLIYDEQEHTDSGKHELLLMSWRVAPFDGVVPAPFATSQAELIEALRDSKSAVKRF